MRWPCHLRFGAAKRLGRLRAGRVRAYLGADPTIDRADHLVGSIDPASQRGAFGHEYHGRMPRGRWLITKLDLLCAQAVGYRLRETSAFVPLRLRTEALPEGTASAPYTATLHAEGGIPSYHWEVVEGSLPDGLALDSFTGEIAGTPREPGDFEFVVKLRGYDEGDAGVSRRLRMRIAADRGAHTVNPRPSASRND